MPCSSTCGRAACRGSGGAARRTACAARLSSSQKMVCSVLAGSSRATCCLVRRRMKGRSACASSLRASSPGLRARPPAICSTLASPSMPGLRNSNRLHSSPRWFSTGVPLSARRCSPRSRRTALADAVRGVLDGLRFVQHDVVELDVRPEPARRAAACRRWSESGRARAMSAVSPRGAGMFEHAQLGREARRLPSAS